MCSHTHIHAVRSCLSTGDLKRTDKLGTHAHGPKCRFSSYQLGLIGAALLAIGLRFDRRRSIRSSCSRLGKPTNSLDKESKCTGWQQSGPRPPFFFDMPCSGFSFSTPFVYAHIALSFLLLSTTCHKTRFRFTRRARECDHCTVTVCTDCGWAWRGLARTCHSPPDFETFDRWQMTLNPTTKRPLSFS